MAVAVACKRVRQFETNSGISCFGALKSFRSTLGSKNFSQLVKPEVEQLSLVDTLAVAKRLKEEGVLSKQADAISEVLNDSMDNVSQSLVSRTEMLVESNLFKFKAVVKKSEMLHEHNLSKFKVEVQSSQGLHFSKLLHENEKLRNDIANMRSELRYEIRRRLEAMKYDVIKYCMGTLVLISAIDVAVHRI